MGGSVYIAERQGAAVQEDCLPAGLRAKPRQNEHRHFGPAPGPDIGQAPHGSPSATAGTEAPRAPWHGPRADFTSVPVSAGWRPPPGGRQLDGSLRAGLQERFGAAAAEAVIHTGPASAAADRLNASAFTVGRHIVFGAGRFDPTSTRGQLLLAHELAHVAQQRNGGPGRSEATAGPGHEAEASLAATSTVLGTPLPALTPAPVSVACAGKDEEESWGKRLWHASTALVGKAKVEARDYVKEKVGEVEGVATEVANLADTVIWAEYAGTDLADKTVDKLSDAVGLSKDKKEKLKAAVQQYGGRPAMKAVREAARKAGLTDPVTGTPSSARLVAKGFDWVDKKSDETIFRGVPKDEGLLSSRDMGVLEGAIGSQVALAFVDVEEVQLAVKAIGAVQSVEGVVAAIQANPKGWQQDRNFWLQVINLALYMAGLAASAAGRKIATILIDSAATLAVTIPAVTRLADDYANAKGPDRDAKLRADIQAVVRAVAQAIQQIVMHSRGTRPGHEGGAGEGTPAGNEGAAAKPAGSGEHGAQAPTPKERPAAVSTPPETAVPAPPPTEPPVPAPVVTPELTTPATAPPGPVPAAAPAEPRTPAAATPDHAPPPTPHEPMAPHEPAAVHEPTAGPHEPATTPAAKPAPATKPATTATPSPAETPAPAAGAPEQVQAKGAGRRSPVRKSVREQTERKLGALQEEKARTQAEITRLENELSAATSKVNRLKEKVLESPRGSEARAAALEEFRAAKEELDQLREEDELGGYREERAKQNKAEEALLESLQLKRPSLWEPTKEAIFAAAKKDAATGRYLDANTGEVITGEPVFGHKKGFEHRRLALKAAAQGMSQEQFNSWVNEHPDWFQLETKANNESHQYEKRGVDGWEQL
jgi:hypothetical protein